MLKKIIGFAGLALTMSLMTSVAEARDRHHDRGDGRDAWGGNQREMFRVRGSHRRDVIHRIRFENRGFESRREWRRDRREWRGDRGRWDRHERKRWRRDRFYDGYGFGGFGISFGVASTDWYGRPDFYDYPVEERVVVKERIIVAGDGVSCRAAARILRNSGYRNVTVRSCNGEIYDFNASTSRRGNVRVRVSSDTGAVVAVRKR